MTGGHTSTRYELTFFFGGGGVVIAQSGRFRISIERVRDEYIFDVDVQLYNYGRVCNQRSSREFNKRKRERRKEKKFCLNFPETKTQMKRTRE